VRPVAGLALHEQPQRLDDIGHEAGAAGEYGAGGTTAKWRRAASKVCFGQLLQMRAGAHTQ
jgi:hypothetical protein